ncbi:hypothetical protein FYJ26_05835 [Anaerococcus sp. WCA-380-WT-2B]|uniref:Xanthine dehydrogenase n=1 Tax=Anaerococcus porci TaxID=2652269 RepID=A0A6N7VW78_9FIRM|nr:XdhC/CoxI family protein [Anaerococcus porci]MSS77939.1 hypothetical protein [Anaerococcus porci]
MDLEILREVVKELENGRNVALAILTETKGSAPGKDNSTMAVFENGKTFGTIGGGPIEYDLTKKALKALKEDKEKSFDYTLNEKQEVKMLCGGQNKGYIKIFRVNPRLLIFGAGHVGQKLARIATKTGFNVVVIDQREDFKNKKDLEDIDQFVLKKPKEFSENFDFNKNTYILIATPDYDEEVLENVIDKDYKFLGMIGSKRKVKRVFDNLREKGVDKKLLDKVHAPVGYPIDDGSVEEIAISIISQIISIKNNKEINK